jgi:hypothetical protein
MSADISAVRGVSELETSEARCTTGALDRSTDEYYAAGFAAAQPPGRRQGQGEPPSVRQRTAGRAGGSQPHPGEPDRGRADRRRPARKVTPLTARCVRGEGDTGVVGQRSMGYRSSARIQYLHQCHRQDSGLRSPLRRGLLCMALTSGNMLLHGLPGAVRSLGPGLALSIAARQANSAGRETGSSKT